MSISALGTSALIARSHYPNFSKGMVAFDRAAWRYPGKRGQMLERFCRHWASLDANTQTKKADQ